MTTDATPGPFAGMNEEGDMMNQPDHEPTSRRPKNTAGRRRAAALSGGGAEAPLTAGAFGHGAPAAFVARESDLYGHMLLTKMIEQTLDPHMHIPAVQAAAALGVTPLLRTPEGDKLREELNARLLYPSDGSGRRFFGVRFEIEGYPFQYGLTTGAGATLQGDNDWVESLVELIQDYRPAKLVAGPAARLARIEPLFVRMEASLKAARTAVVTAETADAGLDLRTQADLDTWRTLAKAAQADYYHSVLRMFTGVLYEVKNNRYPRSATSLYPGYKKRGGKREDRNDILLDLDDTTLTFVRRFIELAASDATDDQVIEELTPLGLRSRHPGLIAEGRDAPEHVDDPRRMLRSLYPALRTYRDGVYPFQHEVPLPDLDQIHGFKVYRSDFRDNGFIQRDLRFPIPDGGWHDSDLLDQAIRRRCPDSDPNTPGTAPLTRVTVKPLAGLFQWTAGGHEYRLLANETESYELRRRPMAEARRASKWRAFRSTDGELLGRFDAELLHRACAQALRKLGNGVPAALPCPDAPLPSDQTLKELRERRHENQRQADAARAEVVLTSDEDAKVEYRELAAKHQKEVRRLSTEIAREEAKRRPVPHTTHDGTRIAALVRVLEDLPGSADTAVARALRGLVRTARIVDAGPGKPLARLSMTLTIRTDTGSIKVGPITVPVKNRAVGGMPGSDGRKQGFKRRNIALLKELLLEGVDAPEREELWETEALTPRNYTRRMFDTLSPLVGGKVASALIHCPIVDVRRAALEPYLRHGIPIDERFGSQLADEISRVYVPNGFTWANGWCAGGMARERQLLAFLDQYADDPDAGLALADVREALAIDDSAVYRMAHEGRAPYGRPTKTSASPWHARVELLHGPGGQRSAGSRIRVRQCPHCGDRKLLQPLRVPEVAGHLLCVGCHKALRSALSYPSEFFVPWDGPQSLPRRQPVSGTVEDKVWFSTSGRIIVGTSVCTVHVPSLHSPRGA